MTWLLPPVVTVSLGMLGVPVLVLVVATFGWFVAFAIVAFRLVRFPCPRCGEPYFYTTTRRVPFTNWCLHCGLPKGS